MKSIMKHPTRDLWMIDGCEDLFLDPSCRTKAEACTLRDDFGKPRIEVFFFMDGRQLRKYAARTKMEIQNQRILKHSEMVTFRDGNPLNIDLRNLEIKWRRKQKRKEATILVDLSEGNRIRIPAQVKGCRRLKITFQEVLSREQYMG
jgi:hypothetical protein